MSDSVDVLLVDDHPLLAEGLRIGLHQRGLNVRVVGELTIDSILSEVADSSPKLVVLDYAIPAIGVSTPLIQPIVELGSKAVILTGTSDIALWGSLIETGAIGVMGKDESLAGLMDGIEQILRGETFRPGKADEYRAAWRIQQQARVARLAPFVQLSTRESEIALALVEGQSPAEIATNSFVSVGTVRSQLKSIFRKLSVSSQLELAAFAREAGWPEPVDVNSPEGR